MQISNHSHKTKRILLLSILLCVLLTTYIYVCNMKQDYHTDEYYTYQLANSTIGPWWYVPTNEWFSPNVLEQQMVAQDEHLFDYEAVIEHEENDYHPFGYTALIHTICSFFPNSFSMWYGLGLNIVFALISVLIIYLCMWKLTKSYTCSLSAAITFGCSLGLVNQIVFTRMYVLTMLLVLLTLWLHIKYYNNPENPKFDLFLGLVSIIGALTHYYFVMYLVLTCIVFFVRLLLDKKKKAATQYALTEILAALVSIAIFPTMTSQIFGGAQDYTTTAGYSYIEKLYAFLEIINQELFGNLLWMLLGALAICACILWRKGELHLPQREHFGQTMLILFPCIAYMLIAAKSAPYLTDRYVSTIYPIIYLAFFRASPHKCVKTPSL